MSMEKKQATFSVYQNHNRVVDGKTLTNIEYEYGSVKMKFHDGTALYVSSTLAIEIAGAIKEEL